MSILSSDMIRPLSHCLLFKLLLKYGLFYFDKINEFHRLFVSLKMTKMFAVVMFHCYKSKCNHFNT